MAGCDSSRPGVASSPRAWSCRPGPGTHGPYPYQAVSLVAGGVTTPIAGTRPGGADVSYPGRGSAPCSPEVSCCRSPARDLAVPTRPILAGASRPDRWRRHFTVRRLAVGRSRRNPSEQGQRALIAGGVISPFTGPRPGGPKGGRPGGDDPCSPVASSHRCRHAAAGAVPPTVIRAGGRCNQIAGGVNRRQWQDRTRRLLSGRECQCPDSRLLAASRSAAETARESLTVDGPAADATRPL